MGNEFNQFSKDMILSRKAKATNFGLKAKEASDHNVTMSVFATSCRSPAVCIDSRHRKLTKIEYIQKT